MDLHLFIRMMLGEFMEWYPKEQMIPLMEMLPSTRELRHIMNGFTTNCQTGTMQNLLVKETGKPWLGPILPYDSNWNFLTKSHTVCKPAQLVNPSGHGII